MLKARIGLAAAVAAMAIVTAGADAQRTAPPFAGTIFIDPDIITPGDPSAFQRAKYVGRAQRQVFDRRADAFVTVRAFVFKVRFKDGSRLEGIVNPEFRTRRAAARQVKKYAQATGRLPKVLRKDVRALWIHKGTQPFGGGNESLLIHTGQSASYEQEDILDETLAHEASHTSIDADHAGAPGWVAAQKADPTFISTYAQENPTREDIAESFVPWLAVRHRADRIDPALAEQIEAAIPHRLDYFDKQDFALGPFAR